MKYTYRVRKYRAADTQEKTLSVSLFFIKFPQLHHQRWRKSPRACARQCSAGIRTKSFCSESDWMWTGQPMTKAKNRGPVQLNILRTTLFFIRGNEIEVTSWDINNDVPEVVQPPKNWMTSRVNIPHKFSACQKRNFYMLYTPRLPCAIIYLKLVLWVQGNCASFKINGMKGKSS